ncbi:MAG: GNAT family N-acetyltransferase [Pirellulales bacterium]|nr:GNAT family N-acetyltransferase [Pirellulales bacterium]
MVPLKTNRLLIRPWHNDDLEALAEINADPDVMRYIGTGIPLTFEETKQSLARHMDSQDRRGYCMWAVEMRDSGEVIGVCGLIDYRDDEVETGWRLARRCWGRGLATEAARCVQNHAFATLNLPRLIAIAYPQNQPSIHIMKKLGMQFRKMDHHAGVEVVYYTVENPRQAAEPSD